MVKAGIPCFSGAGGVGSIPANSDGQHVPSFSRWRFAMKLSPLIQPVGIAAGRVTLCRPSPSAGPAQTSKHRGDKCGRDARGSARRGCTRAEHSSACVLCCSRDADHHDHLRVIMVIREADCPASQRPGGSRGPSRESRRAEPRSKAAHARTASVHSNRAGAAAAATAPARQRRGLAARGAR